MWDHYGEKCWWGPSLSCLSVGVTTWSQPFLKLSPYHSSSRFQVKHICKCSVRTFLFPVLHLLIYNCSVRRGKKRHFSFASWPLGLSEAASEHMAVGGPGDVLAMQPSPPPPCHVTAWGHWLAVWPVRWMGLNQGSFCAKRGGAFSSLSDQGLHPKV